MLKIIIIGAAIFLSGCMRNVKCDCHCPEPQQDIKHGVLNFDIKLTPTIETGEFK